MLFDDIDTLHIPEGINFECTGCGNCCLQWPVPSTAEDRERIIELSRELNHDSEGLSTSAKMPKGQLFRRVEMDVIKNAANQFQFTLEKRTDGRCIFLSDLNRCVLHEQFGAGAKPGMCQLFPFTFTEAPNGFYASVSFASSGALFNQGRSLIEQRQFLHDRLNLFRKLFPTLKLDWSQIQLYDGLPIRWSNYLLLERDILGGLKNNIDQSTNGAHSTPQFDWSAQLVCLSDLLLSKVPAEADLERIDLVSASASSDLVLVRYLLDLYLPEDVFDTEKEPPSAREFVREMIEAPEMVLLQLGEDRVSLAKICAIKLGSLDRESENLCARYLYARVFSKLYFGPGLAHFSLISGFHHLVLLIVLIRIRLKCFLWLTGKADDQTSERSAIPPPQTQSLTNQALGQQASDHLQVAELVRQLERKLATFQHTRESGTILQVLLESPSRFKRLISLAS